jgi:hypothetical protein
VLVVGEVGRERGRTFLPIMPMQAMAGVPRCMVERFDGDVE